jgi:PAS domain S-box-containing protein
MDQPQATILMVDDRPENLLALRAILEPLGCRLVEASSGTEALKYLLSGDYALILMDVQMPGLDGFETVGMIKERERTRHIPIIFVTALSKEQHYVFQGYSSGAVDYISKPFDPDILRSKAAVFVELWEKNELLKRQADQMRQAEHRDRLRLLDEERAQSERRHVAELARFKETLDATLDCVFIFDAQTLRFSYLNQGALKMLGLSPEEAQVKTPLDFQDEFDEPAYRDLLDPLVRGERASLTFETTLRLPSNGGNISIPVEAFLQYIAPPLEAPPEETGGFVSTVRDISERKKAEFLLIAARDAAEKARSEAEQARSQAEMASRAKSDFIAGVSHELRTPLNAILGFSKLLLNPRVGPLNTDQSAYVSDVVHSAEHLLHLINDILDLSKIEAGKMTLDDSAWSLEEVLEQSMAVVREKARDQNLRLETEIAPGAAALPSVPGDARRIKQVLFNLLSNAVKFTPEGGSITVRAARGDSAGEAASDLNASADVENPNGAWLVFSVRDTGVGISPEDQERIFQAFEQVDSSYTRAQQGTGLGLALSRRIVELHGGQLWVQSEPGNGSTFSFRLPLHETGGEGGNGSGRTPGSEVEAAEKAPEKAPQKKRQRADTGGPGSTSASTSAAKTPHARGGGTKAAQGPSEARKNSRAKASMG